MLGEPSCGEGTQGQPWWASCWGWQHGQGLWLLQVLLPAPLASAGSRIPRNVLFPDLFKANSAEAAELSLPGGS